MVHPQLMLYTSYHYYYYYFSFASHILPVVRIFSSCFQGIQGGATQIRFQPRVGRFLAAAADNSVSILDVEAQVCRAKLQVSWEMNKFLIPFRHFMYADYHFHLINCCRVIKMLSILCAGILMASLWHL